MPAEPPRPGVVGAILAGGLGRRMGGGEKPLRLLAGRPLLSWVAARLAPQVEAVLLCANGNPARFASFGLPVAADGAWLGRGPLAGILAGLEWAAGGAVLTVPADTPFLPADLRARLQQASLASGLPACAASGGRTHWAVGCWPAHLRGDLLQGLQAGTLRGIRDLACLRGHVSTEWPTEPLDPFFNVNTPEDLAHAERLAPTVGP